jgi:Vitamin K-dependent gamma-carboxylase
MSKRVQREHVARPAPGVLGRAAAAIHGFFELEIDPFVLGLFRASLGAYVLLFYIMLAPSWTFYYGFPSITPIDRTDTATYGVLSPLFFHMRSNAGMWVLYGVSVASAVLFALGVWWRVAGLWLWQMNVGLMVGSPFTINGEEQVMSILLLFGLFMPLGSTFTLRQLWSRERRRAMLCGDGGLKVKVWALRALQLHLMFVYLISLPDKMTDDSWRNGTLVYYAMMAWDYPRWPGIEIFGWGNAALSRVLTFFALAIEVLVPFLIWFRRWRVPCVLAAMALHVGMGLLIEGVMMFNAAMLVAMLAFLPSRRTRHFVARVLRLRAPGSAVAEPAPTPSPVP